MDISASLAARLAPTAVAEITTYRPRRKGTTHVSIHTSSKDDTQWMPVEHRSENAAATHQPASKRDDGAHAWIPQGYAAI